MMRWEDEKKRMFTVERVDGHTMDAHAHWVALDDTDWTSAEFDTDGDFTSRGYRLTEWVEVSSVEQTFHAGHSSDQCEGRECFGERKEQAGHDE